jgi:hypothetical protein
MVFKILSSRPLGREAGYCVAFMLNTIRQPRLEVRTKFLNFLCIILANPILLGIECRSQVPHPSASWCVMPKGRIMVLLTHADNLMAP